MTVASVGSKHVNKSKAVQEWPGAGAGGQQLHHTSVCIHLHLVTMRASGQVGTACGMTRLFRQGSDLCLELQHDGCAV